MRNIFLYIFCCQMAAGTIVAAQAVKSREHILLDAGWRFAFGHAYDTKKDYSNGTGYFSYLTKAGYGDGAAATAFDDRTWRRLDLPHDWAVEQPFDKAGSFSHGFKAIGRNFPGASIGWYRKKFLIEANDIGRIISVAFDGVFRNSIVWVNGHYLGNHPSGYLGFEYNISEYLNYGGENTIAVRVDATMEEGWFYEGAGIYRHVWLNKTSPLHIATNGTFVTTTLNNGLATLQVATTINNDAPALGNFTVLQEVKDATGKTVAAFNLPAQSLSAFKSNEFNATINITNPILWDLQNPYLYTLHSTVLQYEKVIDNYTTTFGIRTIRFDNNNGFFLNGQHIKIKGTNNHQDHAGVGSAMPDALQEFRIKTLKTFGNNAYRCSHNPPAPELLDACDRLGMLVIDENRMMGITQTHLGDVKRLIERDRNHPSIISWCIGNEEWGIENSPVGARIASTMQSFVKSLDSTRPATAAFSGGIGSKGITTVMDLLGINYIANKSTDEQHRLFPNQSLWGTEEGSTNATRGAYFRDDQQHIIPAYDKAPNKSFLSIEQGWKHYAARPYLAGMFIWTGFDYRGEPTPYGWPSIASYFGMVDLCGFPKDDVWYLKSWWTNDTVLHLLPHWNWKGKEGQPIDVWVYSNCDEVELFLNKKSLGRQAMQPNSHLEWKVNYAPGMLEAAGYKKGKKIATDKVQTTGDAVAANLSADRNQLANTADVAMVTVSANDKNGMPVPVANNQITFSISGPGKIIGVGNGDQTSLEKDKYLEEILVIKIDNLEEKVIDSISQAGQPVIFEGGNWQAAFKEERDSKFGETVKALLYRGSFEMPVLSGKETVSFFYNSIGIEQSVYINGKPVAINFKSPDKNGYVLPAGLLHTGSNRIVIAATPILKKNSWESINMNPGLFQVFVPAQPYKRSLSNGLAQVLVQAIGPDGDIVLTATGKNLTSFSLRIPVLTKSTANKVAK